MKSGFRSLLSLLLVVAGLIVVKAQGVVPVNGTPPTLVPTTVNDDPGDQSDPHISGDWVAYSSDLSIRYYNFVTGIDAQIPMGSSARDLLSDMSGSKIVFSRVITGDRTAVMVFDAETPAVMPTEIDPAAATLRLGSPIGDYAFRCGRQLLRGGNRRRRCRVDRLRTGFGERLSDRHLAGALYRQ